MSPPRRGRAAHSADAAPQCHHKGWLSVVSHSRRHGGTRKERRGGGGEGTLSLLPDDVLGAILASGFLTAVDVVRCAASCRRWRRVVGTRSAYISRGLPPLGGYLSGLAVGVFTAPIARARRRTPQFVPTAAGALLLGDRRISLVDGIQVDGELLEHARPVASRNGRLVLQLRPTGGDLALCVCNPMTGELTMLPPLSGDDKTRRGWFAYGCALLTGDDFDTPRPPYASFRLLLLYNHGASTTVLRCYSSSSGRWGKEVDITGVASISGEKMRQIGPAAVRRGGAAFWPLDDGALGVRLDVERPDAMDVHLLPYTSPHYWPEKRLLGVTAADNRLFFVSFGIWEGCLSGAVSYFDIDGDDIGTGRENSDRDGEVLYPMFDIKMRRRHDQSTLKLRWFCEKSGLVLFTLGEGSGYPGTFALDVRSPAVEKAVNGYSVSWRDVHLESPAMVKVADGHSWSSFVGYEMDMATYLAALAA
uniref:F-box domain-containing protein n=1 Tax=Oryza meridionalis TaxID=40149 RepID=A0A0E0EW90_9ORYZ